MGQQKQTWTQRRNARLKAKGAYKKQVAEANYIKAQAKNLKKETDAQIVKEREKTKRTIARAGSFSSGVAASANALAKSNAAANNALSQWNSLINSSATPAEGTGEAEKGEGDNSSNTTVAPVGN